MATSALNSDMRRLLESVGVGDDVIHNFEAQDITAEIVPTLSEAQHSMSEYEQTVCLCHVLLSFLALISLFHRYTLCHIHIGSCKRHRLVLLVPGRL